MCPGYVPVPVDFEPSVTIERRPDAAIHWQEIIRSQVPVYHLDGRNYGQGAVGKCGRPTCPTYLLSFAGLNLYERMQPKTPPAFAPGDSN